MRRFTKGYGSDDDASTARPNRRRIHLGRRERPLIGDSVFQVEVGLVHAEGEVPITVTAVSSSTSYIRALKQIEITGVLRPEIVQVSDDIVRPGCFLHAEPRLPGVRAVILPPVTQPSTASAPIRPVQEIAQLCFPPPRTNPPPQEEDQSIRGDGHRIDPSSHLVREFLPASRPPSLWRCGMAQVPSGSLYIVGGGVIRLCPTGLVRDPVQAGVMPSAP